MEEATSSSDAQLRKRVTTLHSQDEKMDELLEERDIDEKPKSESESIREIAESMFNEMCKDLHEDIITKDTVDRAIHSLVTHSVNPTMSLCQTQDYATSSGNLKAFVKKLLQDAIHKSHDHSVTAAMFADTALQYSKGDLSLFDLRNVTKEDLPQQLAQGKQKGTSIGLILKYPLYGLRVVYQSALNWIEKQGSRWLWSSLSIKQAYWLIAAYVLPMLTFAFIVRSLSTMLFVGAMTALLIITLQLAINSEKLNLKKEYLSLFQYFNRKETSILVKLPRLDNTHYVNFFVALVLVLLSVEFTPQHLACYSLLSIVSPATMLLITLQFDLHENQLFVFVLIAKMPSLFMLFINKAINYLPIPYIILSLDLPLFNVPLSGGLALKMSVITVIQVVLHVYVLVRWFKGMSWESFYSSLGPLSLFLGWFGLFKYFFSKSSPEYILAFVAVSASLLFLLPLLGVIIFGGLALSLYYYRFTPPFFYSLGFVVGSGVVVLLLLLSWNYLQYFWMSLSLEYAFLLMIATSIPLMLYLSAWYTSLFQPPPLPAVTLEEYMTYCSPENWIEGNSVQTQINCIHLQGRVLSSEGTIKRVGIAKMVDSKADSFKLWPLTIQSALTCILGETEPMCGQNNNATTCLFSKCHFQSSLQHTYEIKMVVGAAAGETIPAKMIVRHRYRECVLNMRAGSVLKFNATFVDGMGSDELLLEALYLSTGAGHDTQSIMKEAEDEEWEMFQYYIYILLRAVKKTAIILADMFLSLMHEY